AALRSGPADAAVLRVRRGRGRAGSRGEPVWRVRRVGRTRRTTGPRLWGRGRAAGGRGTGEPRWRRAAGPEKSLGPEGRSADRNAGQGTRRTPGDGVRRA